MEVNPCMTCTREVSTKRSHSRILCIQTLGREEMNKKRRTIFKIGPIERVKMNDGSIKYIVIKEHYEVHYDDRVDFITLDGKFLGSSKIHSVDGRLYRLLSYLWNLLVV